MLTDTYAETIFTTTIFDGARSTIETNQHSCQPELSGQYRADDAQTLLSSTLHQAGLH
jgi:hypothetical protein